MGLIKCPECGRENVSDTALRCPGCGFGIVEYYNKLYGRDVQIQNTTNSNVHQKKKETKPFYRKISFYLLLGILFFLIKFALIEPNKPTYEKIYNEYSEKISSYSGRSVDELATICAEGVEEMADLCANHGESYGDYQAWATRLYNDYQTKVYAITFGR